MVDIHLISNSASKWVFLAFRVVVVGGPGLPIISFSA